MRQFDLEPENGPHAAADLTDEELDYLVRITSLEMAIRIEADSFSERYRMVAEARAELDEMIERLRRERDLLCFAAEVSADLEQLPLTTDRADDETHGMYL